MRILLHYYSFMFIAILLTTANHSYGQVGINTTTPNGILDITSTQYGVLLPRLALTSTIVQNPALNPQGPSIVPGTTIYNTNISQNGINDVSPGLYVWDGAKWLNQFPKKDASIFKQDMSIEFRTVSSNSYIDIPGLGSNNFIPKYTGVYKMEVSMNYGGGYVKNPTTGAVSVAAQEGIFKYVFNGTTYLSPAKAYSTFGTTQYFLIWEQHALIKYVTLTAGLTYNLSLQFDQLASPEFQNDGNSGNGLGYIGYDIPCSVEFIYLGDASVTN